MKHKPLSGIRVLDLTRLLPGPLCTLHLADLGADVIKIEDTASGDYARHAPPVQKNMSALFLALNRNKRSLVLDIQKEEGKKIFLRLAEKSDVIVESFRPGVLKKFDLDFEGVKKINPRIIYCSITGYGQSGPNQGKAGHDLNFTAEAGALFRKLSAKPQLPAFQMADIVGGTQSAVMGILAAILHREKTGEGQAVDVAMFDGLLTQSVVSLSYLDSFEKLGFDASGMLQGDMPCYNIYETSDGRYVALAAIEYKFWQRFCTVANKPDWLSKHMTFGEESIKMHQELAAFFVSKTLQRWVEEFKEADCCFSPVNSLQEALESEQVKSRKLFFKTGHPTEGETKQFSFPLKLSNFNPEITSQAPIFGEHTVEVLKESGFSEPEIARFKSEKVIV